MGMELLVLRTKMVTWSGVGQCRVMEHLLLHKRWRFWFTRYIISQMHGPTT